VSYTSVVKIPYGCDQFGRLTTVMMHRPGRELELINKYNHTDWLFDEVPDIARFIEEHDRYRQMLISYGVRVLELMDHLNDHRELVSRMPNLTYMHDTAVISSKGAILSSMAWDGRKDEHLVVRDALVNLGIPILFEFDDTRDAFEGCLLLSSETILVAETERHTKRAIDRFMRKALTEFEEVIYVDIPKARRYMHPDTIYNRLDNHLALAYLPAFVTTYSYQRQGVERIDFVEHMRRKGVRIVEVSDSEQRRLACSFVPLEPGVIFHYDTALDRDTQVRLAREGVDIIFFHPDAIRAGGGSLRCLTLRLHRELLS
jgi:arginine deiminase